MWEFEYMDLELDRFLKDNFFIQALKRLSIDNQFFYIKNLDLQYILASENLFSITGIKEEDFLYKKDEEFIWAKQHAKLFNADDTFAIITKNEHISHYSIDLPKGGVRIKTYKTPIVNSEGQSIGLFGIAVKY